MCLTHIISFPRPSVIFHRFIFFSHEIIWDASFGLMYLFLTIKTNKTAVTLRHPVQVNTWFGAEMASVHDWSLVNITSSSNTISHLHCVLSLHTAARRLSPPPLIFLFLPNFLCSFYTPHQMRPASKAFLSWFMGAGDENRLNKKEKRRVPLICRRVSLVTYHVFSFCFLEGGGGCHNVLSCPLWLRGSD